MANDEVEKEEYLAILDEEIQEKMGEKKCIL
jgi:hypothetical protein